MTTRPHVLFAGGASAARLRPGLAVAAHLAQRHPELRITFDGTGKPQQRHAVRSHGFEYATIPSQPLPRNPLHALRFVTDNLAGYCAARWYLKEHHVSLVVGLGSDASAPMVRAAAARGIPVILLEQNVVPGRVTRWLASWANMICLGFDQARSQLPTQTPTMTTGNAARGEFERLYRRIEADPTYDADPTHNETTERRLVVIGGAEGARSLNQFVPLALRQLGDNLRGWRIVHQTGDGQLQSTAQRYREVGVEALVVSHIDEMAPVLFETDLVVCRSDGTTLAELALAGVPAILVPNPRAANNYQMVNAESIAASGAGTIIDEASLIGTLDHALVNQLWPLVADRRRRLEMAESMRAFARPDAAANIAGVVCHILLGEPMPTPAVTKSTRRLVA